MSGRHWHPLFLLLTFVAVYVYPQSLPPNTFYPASIPLAVRSPYLSAWLGLESGADLLPGQWPRFWDDNRILGWSGIVRVDNNNTYAWAGQPDGVPTNANITGFQLTPTRSIFNVTADTIDLTITFLTPIDASDYVRQSIPFSYMSLEASSNDGQSHSVQVYSDISAEWSSSNDSEVVTWSTTATDSSVYHQVQLQSPNNLTEVSNQAEDGTLYYAMSTRPTISYGISGHVTLRTQFEQTGTLTMNQDNQFRTISDNFPVYGISVDLGMVSETTSPVVWAVGFIRDPVIEYTDSTGQSQMRSPFFRTKYRTTQDAINAFLADFPDALARSIALDASILNDAAKVSAAYTDLVSIAARQVMGGIDITVSAGTDGQWNASDVMVFMKDIGNGRRVNPVETIYASFPAFLYLNASLGGGLLAPLLEFQDLQPYALNYAARDLGDSTYPVAPGNTNQHMQGVEQTGNMLIMVLAHARASGNGFLINRHYNLLNNWANYLINQSLIASNQISADLQKQANQTNLAIKGIIGIKAMSEISQALGKSDDATLFANHASALVNQWQSLAVSSSGQQHLLLSYGEDDSWGLMYNLYADVLLDTNLVDASIFENQAQYYSNLFTSAGQKFGLPLSSDDSTQGNSAWTLFTAASTNDTIVRQTLISSVHTHAAFNTTAGSFPTVYNIQSGVLSSGNASPAQGAMFAPLALNVGNKTIVVPSSQLSGSSAAVPSPSSSKKLNVGAVAGGIVAGVIVLVLVLVVVFLWRRRAYKGRNDSEEKIDLGVYPQADPFPLDQPYTPYDPYAAIHMQGNELQHRPPVPAPPVISAKTREALLNQSRSIPTHPSSATSSDPASSREPPSAPASSSSANAVSPTDVSGLRNEVENLRRVMEELQADRIIPPPLYES